MAANGGGGSSGGGGSCVSAHADLSNWTPNATVGSIDVYIGLCDCPQPSFAFSAMVVESGEVVHHGGLANHDDMKAFKSTLKSQAAKGPVPGKPIAEYDLWKLNIVVPCPPPK